MTPQRGRSYSLHSLPLAAKCLRSLLSEDVHLLPGRFGELNEWDSRLQKVRVVLLLPRCSVSALCDPVAHILQEDGDRDLLCDLSQGFVSDAKLQSLVTRQRQDLSHVFTFSKVRAVVYCTCSVYAEENATLVESTLEKAVVRPKLRPFRITSAGWTVKTDEKFFQLQESDTTDGCFLCVLKREDPVEPESIQNILARAAAKGLLGGLTASESTEHTKPREGQVERERERKRERKRERHRHAPDSLPPTNTARLLNDSSVDTTQFPTAPDGPMVASDGTSPSPALKLPPQDPEDARLSSSVSAVLNGASEVEGQQLKSHRRRSRAPRHTRLHPGHETLRHWWAKHVSLQKGPVAHRSHAARKKPRNLPGGRKAEQEAPSPGTGSAELAQAHKPLPPVSPPRSSPLSSGSSLRRPRLSDKSANTAPLESSGSSDSRDSVLVSSRS
ncbi:uncharacterized protein LOC143495191 [Brachyhypopomus gauderio]|uniref:uncharacterized protein LOC143495191 n=1 Tax=Brachyhypopomus gauderio TaxID=698409 RepID=UPI004043216C